MKAVILAGGFGTRISEETHLKPKPMIEVGGKPILWHIMKMYSAHRINDFIICCGFKGYLIKEYFANYFLHMSDVTFDMSHNSVEVHQKHAEPWRVTVVDTGENSLTGTRLKKVSGHLIKDENFCFTYGDGVSSIDIGNLIEFHKSHGKLATVSAVFPPERYGVLKCDGNSVINFAEKPNEGNAINGGFFVLSTKCLDLIPQGENVIWEQGPLKALVSMNQLVAYNHKGFWHSMDTLRDKNILEKLWADGDAPWKVWE